MLLPIELSLLYQMRDPCFKFDEDQTNNVISIESDRLLKRTDGDTFQVILYLSNAINCIGEWLHGAVP